MISGNSNVQQALSLTQLPAMLPHIQHRILSHIEIIDSKGTKPTAAYACTSTGMRDAAQSFNLSKIAQKQGVALSNEEVNTLTAAFSNKSTPPLLAEFKGLPLQVKSNRQSSEIQLNGHTIGIAGRVSLLIAGHDAQSLITAGNTGTSESKLNIISNPMDAKAKVQTLSQGGEPIQSMVQLPNGMLIAAGGLSRHHLRFYEPQGQSGEFKLLEKRVAQPAGIMKLTALSNNILLCESKSSSQKHLYLVNDDKFIALVDPSAKPAMTAKSTRANAPQQTLSKTPADQVSTTHTESKTNVLNTIFEHCEQAEAKFNKQEVPQAQAFLKTARSHISQLEGTQKAQGLKRINEVQRKMIIAGMKSKSIVQSGQKTSTGDVPAKVFPRNGVVVGSKRAFPKGSAPSLDDMTLVKHMLNKDTIPEIVSEAKAVIQDRLAHGRFGLNITETTKRTGDRSQKDLATLKDILLDIHQLSSTMPEIKGFLDNTLSNVLNSSLNSHELNILAQSFNSSGQEGSTKFKALCEEAINTKAQNLERKIDQLSSSIGQLKFGYPHASSQLDTAGRHDHVKRLLGGIAHLSKVPTYEAKAHSLLHVLAKKINAAVLEELNLSQGIFTDLPACQQIIKKELTSRQEGITESALWNAISHNMSRSNSAVSNGDLNSQLSVVLKLASGLGSINTISSSKTLSKENLSLFTLDSLTNAINTLVKERSQQLSLDEKNRTPISREFSQAASQILMNTVIDRINGVDSSTAKHQIEVIVKKLDNYSDRMHFLKSTLKPFAHVEDFLNEVHSDSNMRNIFDKPINISNAAINIALSAADKLESTDASAAGTLNGRTLEALSHELHSYSVNGGDEYSARNLSRLLISHLENLAVSLDKNNPLLSHNGEYPENLILMGNITSLLDGLLSQNKTETPLVNELKDYVRDELSFSDKPELELYATQRNSSREAFAILGTQASSRFEVKPQ